MTTAEQLRAQGFYLFRRNFYWGQTEGWKHDDGCILYVTGNIERTPEEMFEYLKTHWRPTCQNGRDNYCRMIRRGGL